MFVTPSDIHNVEVGDTIGLDFIDYEGNNINMEQMIIDNLYSGNWNVCRINDESIVIANENIFKEILNIEAISDKLDNNVTINCSSMEEAMVIKNQLVKDKNSIENSMEYMGTLECIHQQKISSEFVRVTPNIDKPINLAKKEQEAIFKVVSSPYGIANIEKISKKSFFIKLFNEGTLMEVYNSFIGEIALIEFSKAKQEHSFFDLFGDPKAKVIFTNEE